MSIIETGVTAKGQFARFKYKRPDGVQITHIWYSPCQYSAKMFNREAQKAHALWLNECQNGAKTKKELKAEAEAAKKAEALKASREMTFAQFVEKKFLPKKAEESELGTLRNYETYLRLYVTPYLGEMLLTDIRPIDIDNLMAKLSKQKSRQTKEPLSVASRTWAYCAIHSVLSLAVDLELIPKNPCLAKFKPRETKSGKKANEVEAFTAEEVAEILKAVKNEGIKWQAFTMLALETGARRSELLGLKWDNINLSTGEILINCQAHYVDGQFVESPTKNGKPRTNIIYSAECLALLKAIKADQIKKGVFPLYVFNADNSSLPIRPDSVTRFFSRFGKKYGFKDLHCHKLRHTFISLALQNNAAPIDVAFSVGHASPAFTFKTYAHTDSGAAQRVSNILQSVMNM